MRVLILGDTHFGLRNDNPIFISYFNKFFTEKLYPFLDANQDIKTIIHLGDVFDKRTHLNVYTTSYFKNVFFDELKKRNIDLRVIIGNHDIFFKESNAVNSLKIFAKEYDNLTFYENPQEIILDKLKVLIVPWVNKENEKQTNDLLKKTDAEYLFGHISVQNMQMMKGVRSDHGFSQKDLFKFHGVFSGHFHHRSKEKNIHYFGVPYEMTWSDHGNTKGFHVLDTETKQLDFYPNDITIHKIIKYNNGVYDKQNLNSCFVKIEVESVEDAENYDKFLEYVTEQNPYNVQILDKRDLAPSSENIEKVESEVEDTISIILKEIEKEESTTFTKEDLSSFMRELYKEAMSRE